MTTKKIKPIDALTDDEWNLCLETLETELGIEWLQTNAGNPVQILWQREDIPASQELYFLSKAIQNLKNINEVCLKRQIEDIKSDNYNVSRGHCFEVILLSYFQNNYKMFPTSDGNPGVDGVIKFDNIQMNCSFKSFGISSHQIEFQNKAKNIENNVKKLFDKRKCNNVNIAIIFTKYPETNDIWDSLEKQIVADASIYNGESIVSGNKNSGYCYKIEELNFENLANTNVSCIFFAASPFHKNEEKNFCSKLDDAVTNLLQLSSLEDTDKELKNALLIHIPESINISNCIEWGQEYLNDSNKHINLIGFYQTYIAQDEETSGIKHAWQYITKDLALNEPIVIEIPIGEITNETMPLAIKETGDKLKNMYIYQNGDLYKNTEMKPNGTLTGNLSSIAIGVKTHIVFTLPGDNKTHVISPKIFSPDNKLLII